MRKNPDGQVELVLENRQLLATFFVIVALCGVFFSLGYIVGRNTLTGAKVAQAAPGTADSANKPSPMPPAVFANETPLSPAPAVNADEQADTTDLNFYESVEEKGADAKLMPPEGSTAVAANTPQHPANSAAPAVPAQPVAAMGRAGQAILAQTGSTPSTTLFAVQVSALTRREDAGSLLSLIKGKNLPVQVVEGPSDKLFRVIVGPYATQKEAEAAKAALEEDGFRPIIKK
ncbi:MAG: SPOR domain-containing protein [Acidobacteria bacterium]|nr:SPOR domain-containing protein [Acidobacteriota bacterium]